MAEVTRIIPSRWAAAIRRAQAAPSGSSGTTSTTTSNSSADAASSAPRRISRLFGVCMASKTRSTVRTAGWAPPGPRAT
jgi:hypothetical protein